MIVRANHQSDFFDLAAHDGGLTLPPELARIDELLEASDLGARVEEEMRKRWPKNPQRGRRSLPAECYLRLLVLKHYKDWSYRELVEEVKWNIAYRRFCRLGGQKMPHYSAVARIGQLLHGEVVAELNRQQVTGAVEEKLVAGRKMRVDTTVVESNIHYPTDSSLLGDGIRVLTREASGRGHGPGGDEGPLSPAFGQEATDRDCAGEQRQSPGSRPTPEGRLCETDGDRREGGEPSRDLCAGNRARDQVGGGSHESPSTGKPSCVSEGKIRSGAPSDCPNAGPASWTATPTIREKF